MRVDWCVSSWFRIKNTHSLTHSREEYPGDDNDSSGYRERILDKITGYRERFP